MNGILINPFNHITHPTAVQTSLSSGALIARFDPTGKYLVAGRFDGLVYVWDLDTKATVRRLEGHVKGITGVDWSRYSRYVLTCSKDWNIIVWDLLSPCDPPQRQSTTRFDAPIVSACFHPLNSQIILTLLSTGEVYLVDLRAQTRGRLEITEPHDDDSEEEESEQQVNKARSAMTVARFDPSGRLIFVGTSTGSILVFNSRTQTMLARHKINGAGILRGLDFAKGGRRLITNSSDRVLRQFLLPIYPAPSENGAYVEQDLEPTHRFSDPITRTAWHATSFSPDGEWLAGGAADPSGHKIYIWDLSNDGQFVTALDGGKEPLVHVHWHPYKSSIASTTNQGNILIWHSPTAERWGAFAGGFEEVDENVVYEEREDEFDIADEVTIKARKMKAEEEAVDVDGVDEYTEASQHRLDGLMLHGDEETDEDILWAIEEPDEDVDGWQLKLHMLDDYL